MPTCGDPSQVTPSRNHPAQPLEPSHHVLYTRPSVPTLNRSMCSVNREIAATCPPALPTPPDTRLSRRSTERVGLLRSSPLGHSPKLDSKEAHAPTATKKGWD